jgi:hypothetical protein
VNDLFAPYAASIDVVAAAAARESKFPFGPKRLASMETA